MAKEVVTTILVVIMLLFANAKTQADLKPGKNAVPIVVKVNSLNRMQGEVLAVYVQGGSKAPQGTFLQETLNFQPKDGGWVAFAGISYYVEPGEYPLNISLADGRTIEKKVQVDSGSFKASYVTVSASQAQVVNPQPEDQAIIQRKTDDQKKVQEAYTTSKAVALWTEPFIRPTEGSVTTDYGYTRYVNGKLNNRHSGWDIANKEGTPIYAANEGIVRLAENLLVTGNTIIVEHGGGVFSSYSHMSKLVVKTGDRVTIGQEIAKMGNTGVSTGSHLHWVMRIGSAYLHPGKFIGNNLFEGIDMVLE